MRLSLWLRWSWRDLREHWLQVTVIGLVIALGTGVYAGLGSTTPWRLKAVHDAYASLHMYDLRVKLAPGSYVSTNDLLAALARIEHPDWVQAAETRLIEPTFVSTAGNLTRGELVGVDTAHGGPHINGLHAQRGRLLTAADSGQPVALLDYHYAQYYDLPAQGQIELSGGVVLDYVGQALTPEHLMIVTVEGGYMAQANLAIVFAPLATVQDLTGHAGQANDLVLTFDPAAELPQARAEIEAALHDAFPGVGFTLMVREDDPVYVLMFEGIDMNQEFYDLIAVLFLAGAMFGAFNLASRIVESQRRQIGIGMALGVPPRLLAVRPLLVGAQIALLGAVFGLVMGVGIARIAEAWMRTLMPMPHYGALLQTGVFLRAALLGLVLPFVAVLYPVWRAVRVTPVDAIHTGNLVAKGGGLAPVARPIPLPGRSFMQMPVRNLLRSPQRTLLTVLGIASAITTLISLVGILDSARNAQQEIRDEAYQAHPDRHMVMLNTYYDTGSGIVGQVTANETVAQAAAVVRVPGRVSHGFTDFGVMIDLLDLDNPLWSPTVIKGQKPTASNPPGVLLSKNAALDLDVAVGDVITLEHPRREGLFSYQLVQTDVVVTGLHADPWRLFVYMDRSQAALMGLAGTANLVHVDPATGVDGGGLKNAMFALPAVTSVVSASDTVESTETVMREVTRFLSAVELAVFALAFLIAFNATNINLNERAREVATMFAFGLPIRTVTRMAMIENLLIGLVGTLIGIIPGLVILMWFLTQRMPDIMPALRFEFALSPTTLVMAAAAGIGSAVIAPLFTMRRMREMDISATLRVME
jgi:putative ABC transport system permease protein